MSDLTADQLSDIRFDLADINSAFSDTELNRLWTRLSSVSGDTLRLEAVKGLAVRAILHDAAKFNSYTAGKTSEQKDQIFQHYQRLYDSFYRKAVEAALGTSPSTAWAALREIPHATRTEPSDDAS